ncbi:ABC-type transporter [Acidisarcina polymorpha]|uniref:ABC-type transporter n=1 Tax=Acidisarcina polymorpha TaxID=2211140 RepID=A0A2Z5G3Z7_9BACT|nr:ABC transporter permease [Acidisarcina polymorpha]AXC13801.1 ABC-type transporter [Acidisarcina polymorpha]
MIARFFELFGKITLFGLAAIRDVFRPPFELFYFLQQLYEIGVGSLLLILTSGFALGVVMTLHTRGTLIQFGAESEIPTFQAMSFLNEIGPLVAALLIAGRVGAGIGAQLANMRATEQIDAIETLSIDSFKFLVVTRIVACTLMLPILTVFMDAAGILGGFASERVVSHLSFRLYFSRAFDGIAIANLIPPTLKTAVFGFLIGTISCFFGYTTDEGSDGVRRASTSSVVVSSLAVILADVILVKLIFFIFPDQAI